MGFLSGLENIYLWNYARSTLSALCLIVVCIYISFFSCSFFFLSFFSFAVLKETFTFNCKVFGDVVAGINAVRYDARLLVLCVNKQNIFEPFLS